MEDENRKYYLPSEIKQFNGIECEWPIFYVYLIIDSIITGKTKKVRKEIVQMVFGLFELLLVLSLF